MGLRLIHCLACLAPVCLSEWHERAKRDLLLHQLRRTQAPGHPPASRVGRLLVQVGTRLQSTFRSTPITSSWLPTVASCPGCAN